MKQLCLIGLILCTYFSYGQSVEGFDLSKYPSELKTIKKKSPLKWSTNPFKNRIKEIKEGYEIGEISFAGNYITVLWNKGKDTVEGAMIDPRNGIIYKLPISPSNTLNHCQEEEDVFDRYLFLPNSRVFVTSVCTKKTEKGLTKVHQLFYFYLWNEDTKKFSLIKTQKKER